MDTFYVTDDFYQWIKKYEGFNEHPYLDTMGKVTIGYGRNLDAKGISTQEADFLFVNDIYSTLTDLNTQFWFHYQPVDVKRALINMCFNLGLSKFLTFQKMIDALIAKDYLTAAKEALDSEWAKQVGQRAKDIAVMIREAK